MSPAEKRQALTAKLASAGSAEAFAQQAIARARSQALEEAEAELQVQLAACAHMSMDLQSMAAGQLRRAASRVPVLVVARTGRPLGSCCTSRVHNQAEPANPGGAARGYSMHGLLSACRVCWQRLRVRLEHGAC